MKHAGAGALEALEDLLRALRARGDLVERSPGVFYRRGRAFLHFHEDPAGLFADLRAETAWERFPVHDASDRAEFIRLLAAVTAPSPQTA